MADETMRKLMNIVPVLEFDDSELSVEDELKSLNEIITNNRLTPEQIKVIEDTKKLVSWMHDHDASQR